MQTMFHLFPPRTRKIRVPWNFLLVCPAHRGEKLFFHDSVNLPGMSPLPRGLGIGCRDDDEAVRRNDENELSAITPCVVHVDVVRFPGPPSVAISVAVERRDGPRDK